MPLPPQYFKQLIPVPPQYFQQISGLTSKCVLLQYLTSFYTPPFKWDTKDSNTYLKGQQIKRKLQNTLYWYKSLDDGLSDLIFVNPSNFSHKLENTYQLKTSTISSFSDESMWAILGIEVNAGMSCSLKKPTWSYFNHHFLLKVAEVHFLRPDMMNHLEQQSTSPWIWNANC